MSGDTDREIMRAISFEMDELDRIKRRAVHAEKRLHAECASMVLHARREAHLTQLELSRLIGTSQSAVARFEDPEHGVRTLAMMAKIACALGFEYTQAFVRVGLQSPGRAVIMAPPPAHNRDFEEEPLD